MKRAIFSDSKSLLLFCALLGMCGQAIAQSPQGEYQPLTFGQESTVIVSSLNLKAGHYRGAGAVILRPGQGQTCSLEIAPSTIVETTKFIVFAGAQLRVRGALLRQCQILAEPGAEVSIDSCALDACEIGGDRSAFKRPTSVRISNSVLYGGGWMAGGNLFGLEMMDCIVQGQVSETHLLRLAVRGEDTPIALARRPAIRYTKFINCKIDPTLMYGISQVSIEGCKCLFKSGVNLLGGPEMKPEVSLPVFWMNNNLPTPPRIGAGIAIQQIQAPLTTGCSVAYEMKDNRLHLTGLAETTPQPLTYALAPGTITSVAVAMDGSSPSSVSASGTDAETSPLKLKQAHMNGLFVMELNTGRQASVITRMNITAVAGNSSVRFIQSVGESMGIALREVDKFMKLRHTFPTKSDLEIAFDEKYSSKDGPSAAVACALLIESVMTGKKWDPAFAVTGDMNADGAVQPVGGVGAKVRGATKGACKIVGVPVQNENAIADILVTDGPVPLVAIHVFALTNFTQAEQLANLERTPELQQALADFEAMRVVLMRDYRQAPALLRNPHAVARLQSILARAPHSLSAKYLLAYALKSAPTTLSLSGSLTAADTHGGELLKSIKVGSDGKISNVNKEEIGNMVFSLRKMRPQLDARVRPYVDGLVDFGEIVRAEMLNPSRTVAKYNDMADRANRALSEANSVYKGLMADPRVMEDLGL